MQEKSTDILTGKELKHDKTTSLIEAAKILVITKRESKLEKELTVRAKIDTQKEIDKFSTSPKDKQLEYLDVMQTKSADILKGKEGEPDKTTSLVEAAKIFVITTRRNELS